MSIFASQTRVTMPIPFDLPNDVTLQALTGRQLSKAAKAFYGEMISDIQARGGAKVQKDIQTLWEKDPKDAKAEVEKVKADPLNGYDPYALLYKGIVAWSYPDSLSLVPVVEKADDGHDVTVMRIPAIEDLGAEAVDFFAREILRLTKPALFLTAEEATAEQKNA
jgi:hypothetical protein